jgi:hypothetical protein
MEPMVFTSPSSDALNETSVKTNESEKEITRLPLQKQAGDS